MHRNPCTTQNAKTDHAYLPENKCHDQDIDININKVQREDSRTYLWYGDALAGSFVSTM